MKVRALYFEKNTLYLLDQRLLPGKIKYVACRTASDVASAIKDMVVRGAPAIGCAAAYGYYLASVSGGKKLSGRILSARLAAASAILAAARPTAVNLAWAVGRMKKIPTGNLLAAADKIRREDAAMNRKIGDLGAALFKKDSNILTHCNAGALATAGYGTALGIVRSAWRDGKIKKVFVDETRPYLQGARLTAWELVCEKIPHVLITDNMAGHFMSRGEISAIVVGADRITANGDTANKIGTYSLAVLAAHHGIPFYVAAPSSTIDARLSSGKLIPIEERSPDEVVFISGKRIAPPETMALHPAFDVTPARFITAIITEKGVFRKPYAFK